MTNFHLTIRKFQQTCLFELLWGNGQRLSATLNYPDSLDAAYQGWQHMYLSYYQSGLRGWIEAEGNLASPPVDWHGKLVQGEARLLSEFHHWLRGAELFEIRQTIARQISENFPRDGMKIREGERGANLFVTLTSMELERLPWETWEVGAELPRSQTLRITRSPMNIRHATTEQSPSKSWKQPTRSRQQARVLVILGDETGLNFQGDREAIRCLERSTRIEFVGGQPGENLEQLRGRICRAIADERGWDVLLFAGHSNETTMTGGEIAIAPQTFLSLTEIAPQLLVAKERGLQFALFNSCNGLSLAHSLIDLGLSQVAVMREPIHNNVAHVFLLEFLKALADGKDVHDCLLVASAFLKQSKNLTYPSAYLIPSLFRHPGSHLFQIPQKPSIWQRLQPLLPTPTQAIALATLTGLSLFLPVQNWLIEKRVLAQSVYRHLTQQIPPSSVPPVLLVQIDQKSIQKAHIPDPRPMDREYLAQIVDRLAASEARVIGLDYLLDRSHGKNDVTLGRSFQAALENQSQPPIFIFASDRDDTGEWLNVRGEIANPNWSLQGHLRLFPWYMTLLPSKPSKTAKLPLAYLLALSHQFQAQTAETSPSEAIPTPQLSRTTNFLSDLTRYLQQERDEQTLFSPAFRLQPITAFSYGLRQMWLHPIVDFSIPPEQVYQTLPAWQLLESQPSSPELANLKHQVTLIAARYAEAGIDFAGQDRFPLPDAMDYWFSRNNPAYRRTQFTGGEIHAYIVHHYLNQRLIIPIPDVWGIGLAILFGKTLLILADKQNLSHKQRRIVVFLLTGTLGIYSIISLQLYISAAILLPWLFPTATLGLYALALLKKRPQIASQKLDF